MKFCHVFSKPKSVPSLSDLTRAVNALPRNMTSQMFNAIAAVTGQGQNPNTTPAQWASVSMVTVAAAVEEVAAAAALITYETCTSAFSLTH